MIIDVHSHAWLFPDHFTDSFRKQARDIARADKPLDLSVTYESYREGASEVIKTVVFGGKAKKSGLWVEDSYVSKFVASHPDYLIGFLSVDPTQQNWEDEMRFGHQELGLKGIKLLPMYAGFYPNDPSLEPLWTYAETNQLPILLHTGTTFIAQDTGMDNIGPFTFNAVRFFVGFLAITPLVLIFELKKFKSQFKLDLKSFLFLSFLIGLSLFLGSALQQVALLYTDVANAAFFTIFYVPMVPIIIFLFRRQSIHWSVWPSVILCLIGGYLLTNFYDATVRLGDTLVVLGALFWSTHIIFTGIIIKKYNLPLTLGAIQTLIVALFSFAIGFVYEEFIYVEIMKEINSILYAGILSGGFAFVLQIYAQENITPAPAAIIFSLEGVFATIAAWYILDQILDINNLLGCFFILCGVLLSQLLPLVKKRYS